MSVTAFVVLDGAGDCSARLSAKHSSLIVRRACSRIALVVLGSSDCTVVSPDSAIARSMGPAAWLAGSSSSVIAESCRFRLLGACLVATVPGLLECAAVPTDSAAVRVTVSVMWPVGLPSPIVSVTCFSFLGAGAVAALCRMEPYGSLFGVVLFGSRPSFMSHALALVTEAVTGALTGALAVTEALVTEAVCLALVVVTEAVVTGAVSLALVGIGASGL